MASEAGYLLAAIGGGTYRTTIPIEILAQKLKNSRKIQKKGAEIQKSQKNSPLRGKKRFFSAKARFIQSLSGPTARGRG